MAPRRRYTKTEKARAVAKATLTTVEAAAETEGVPRSTLRYWMDDPDLAELRHKTRDQVADEMWTAIQIGIAEIAKGLRGEEPLRDKATAVGILYDKRALLTGGATGRYESRDLSGTLSDSDIIDAIREADKVASTGGSAAEDPVPAEG